MKGFSHPVRSISDVEEAIAAVIESTAAVELGVERIGFDDVHARIMDANGGKLFETIKGEFPEFSWGGSINLLTLAKSGARARLESRLAKMQGIKPKKSYPHMTVSKFLHFYNPGLFPIYDNKVIWEGVFKRFRNDFRVFCGARKFRMIGRLTTALRPSCSITWTGQVRF